MKRLFAVLCAFAMLFALTACGQTRTPAKESTWAPHVFSEETEQMIDLLNDGGDTILFYDYDLDESLKSVCTQLWTYEDGQWVSKNQSIGDLREWQGQYGFKLTEDGYTAYDITENGHVAAHYDGAFTPFEEGAISGATWSQNPTTIVPNEEIVLYYKFRAPEGVSSMQVSSDNFREIPSAGYALTITFYDTLYEDPAEGSSSAIE